MFFKCESLISFTFSLRWYLEGCDAHDWGMRIHILFRLLLEPRVSIAVISFDKGMVCNLSSLPDHKFHEWDIPDMLMMILFRLPEMFFMKTQRNMWWFWGRKVMSMFQISDFCDFVLGSSKHYLWCRSRSNSSEYPCLSSRAWHGRDQEKVNVNLALKCRIFLSPIMHFIFCFLLFWDFPDSTLFVILLT